MTPHDEELQHLQSEVERLKQTVAELSSQSGSKSSGLFKPCVRRNSPVKIWGLPLYSIATGPDPDNGEKIGRAVGIVAIGDDATGVVAIGGMALGVLALGGIARGVFAIGGLALGIFAVGGCAAGAVAAVGGVAVGYFAVGGVAWGVHPVGGMPLKV